VYQLKLRSLEGSAARSGQPLCRVPAVGGQLSQLDMDGTLKGPELEMFRVKGSLYPQTLLSSGQTLISSIGFAHETLLME